MKAIGEWYPKKEMEFANGIFNSGTNIGAIVAPLTVPFIAASFGWQCAFIITGAIGFIWLLCWWLIYEIPSKHKKLSSAEYKYRHCHNEETSEETLSQTPVCWRILFGYK